MRTRFVHLLMAIVPIALVASCDRPQPEPDLPPLTAAEITADLLWERITIESDYGNYNFWPGHEGENPGQSPHGPVHRIYANKTLLEALPIANQIAPNVTIMHRCIIGHQNILHSGVVVGADGFGEAGASCFGVF